MKMHNVEKITKKQWRFRGLPETSDILELDEQVKAGKTISTILLQRGIADFSSVKNHFNPTAAQLRDPFMMHGMAASVDRLHKAIAQKERILVYGDYDVDGTTAVALLYGFLKTQTDGAAWYIPDRYAEGYGISWQGIAFAADNAFDLIIAVDCGVRAVDKVARAKSLGIDMIICDHHLPGAVLPDALLLNPKQPECPFPYKELTGCGIAFKLAHAYCLQHHLDTEPLLHRLDLVALSIAADIVDVTGENRTLAWLGLQVLNSGAGNPGIMAILTSGGKALPVVMEDLVFVAGPRVNAAGRMASAADAVEVLLSGSLAEARERAVQLEEHNKFRRNLDRQTADQALEIISVHPFISSACSTVVMHPDWHKGVVGIVASRLIEVHYRPTVVLTEVDGVCVGSARTIEGFDLFQALLACEDVLLQFGGHVHAAGLSLESHRLTEFMERFDAEVRKVFGDTLPEPVVDVDLLVEEEDVNERLCRILQRMEPFGPGNMKPVFAMHDMVNAGSTRAVGKNGEHLKLEVRKRTGDVVFQGIAFGMGHMAPVLRTEVFSLAFTLEFNEWQGRKTLQLQVKDIQLGSPAATIPAGSLKQYAGRAAGTEW
jgi:single-stranded-DNA-specific exonuclease